MSEKIRIVCETCRSTDVRRDAWAEWDESHAPDPCALKADAAFARGFAQRIGTDQAPAVELTPAGEQLVIPGCERQAVAGPFQPKQGKLWD